MPARRTSGTGNDMRAGIITALVLHLLMFATAFAAEPAALQPFAFLVGDWAATGSGQPGEGIGEPEIFHYVQDDN